MKGVSWIIDLIESARVGVIQNKRLYNKDMLDKARLSVNFFMGVADNSVQQGAICGKQEANDWEQAQMSYRHYEEYVTLLLSQLPD